MDSASFDEAPLEDIRKAYATEIRDRPFSHHGHEHALAAAASLDLWHERLNHTDKSTIEVMYDRGVAEGLKIPLRRVQDRPGIIVCHPKPTAVLITLPASNIAYSK